MNRALLLPLLLILIALPGLARPDSLDVSSASAGKPKSVSTGLLLSSIATLVPAGIGTAIVATTNEDYILQLLAGEVWLTLGTMLGPLAGHVYAGQWGRSCLGLGFRTAAVCAAGLFRSNSDDETSEAFSWLALGAAAASIVFDIATVPASVRKYNQEHGLALDADVNFGQQQLRIGLVKRL